MSKSRRLPYASVCGVVSSNWDKTIARRAVRRSENHYLRDVLVERVDWDEVPIPERYECFNNDVWGWNRDGNQRLQKIGHNDLNPFYLPSWHRLSDEGQLRRHKERLARHIRYIERLKRK